MDLLTKQLCTISVIRNLMQSVCGLIKDEHHAVMMLFFAEETTMEINRFQTQKQTYTVDK